MRDEKEGRKKQARSLISHLKTCMWSQRMRFFDALIFRALTGLGDKISDFQVLNVKSGNYANEFAQIQAKFKQVQSHC